MAPEARSGSSFIETLGNKTSLKKIIGKDASLGKTIHPLTNLDVYPIVRSDNDAKFVVDDNFNTRERTQFLLFEIIP